MSIKIVIMGGKDITCRCLNYLLENKKNVIAVVSNNDNKEDLWYQSLADFAEKKGLNVLIPGDVNDIKFIEELKNLKPDLGISIYFSQILKRQFLNIFPMGCINLHFAPLPKYRGVMPIPWAIINEEKKHGVTLHYIDEGIDSGDIIEQKFVDISEDDTGMDLYKKCEKAGFELFTETFPLIEQCKNKRVKQDDSKMSYYKKSDFKSFEVDLSWSGKKIFNFVRALTFPPLKPAYMKVGDKIIYLTTEIQNKGDRI